MHCKNWKGNFNQRSSWANQPTAMSTPQSQMHLWVALVQFWLRGKKQLMEVLHKNQSSEELFCNKTWAFCCSSLCEPLQGLPTGSGKCICHKTSSIGAAIRIRESWMIARLGEKMGQFNSEKKRMEWHTSCGLSVASSNLRKCHKDVCHRSNKTRYKNWKRYN